VGVVSGDFKRPNGQTNTYAYGVYARIDVVYDVIEKVLLAVDAGNTPSPNDVPRQSAPSKP
jgi:hypothetical protein